MLKRFIAALGIIAGLLSPAYPAGTISFSLSQQLGTDAKPLANCFLYVIEAGTVSTPQNAYQDTALTIPHPNPLRCDSAGRLPQFFLADGLIKIRLTDKNGIDQNYPNGSGAIDNILVIGPSSGGGGGGSIDPTTILATGDFKLRYDTGSLAGFVRCNARTIGSATSGATERANADTQQLFEHFWNKDPNLAVSGGRGANSAADWAANKTLTLPDCRGRAFASLGDMGNSATSVLTSTYCATPTVLGAVCGLQFTTLATGNLPPTSVAVSINDPGHTHTPNYTLVADALGGPTDAFVTQGGSNVSALTNSTNTTGITASGSLIGAAATAFTNLSPIILITTYIKL